MYKLPDTVGVVFGLSVLFTSETKETTWKEPPPLTQRQLIFYILDDF